MWPFQNVWTLTTQEYERCCATLKSLWTPLWKDRVLKMLTSHHVALVELHLYPKGFWLFHNYLYGHPRLTEWCLEWNWQCQVVWLPNSRNEKKFVRLEPFAQQRSKFRRTVGFYHYLLKANLFVCTYVLCHFSDASILSSSITSSVMVN